MSAPSGTGIPLDHRRVADLDFLDARSKLIDVAAFLDRYERARTANGDPSAPEDYRVQALRAALEAAAGPAPEKAKAVQLIFSDPTEEPIPSAAGMKGAAGAWEAKG